MAGTKSEIVIEVNICYTSPYLKGTQYIKDVNFIIFFLNSLPGDTNFSTREGIVNFFIYTKKYLHLIK